MPVTLQAFILPKDVKIVMATSLWNSNIPIFCFCTVQKRFCGFAIEVFNAMQRKATTISLTQCELYMWTQTDRKDQHHSFACYSPQKVLALVHQLVSWLTLTIIELC